MTEKQAIKIDPKISIIVPVYNVEKYLEKCIDSIINQSYKELEIILINDGSIDKSGEICNYYSKKDNRVLVIHQENQGQSSARNNGLNIASGSYIGCVDSDDWIEPDMYKTMIDLALVHDLDIAECSIDVSGKKKNEIDKRNIEIETVRNAIKRILKTTQFSVCTKLFRKSVIANSRFLLNRTSEDALFVVNNIPKANKIGFYNFPFYNYRPNPQGTTKSQYNLKRFDDAISSCFFVKERLMPLATNSIESSLSSIDHELITEIKGFLLRELMFHYKMLNYNSTLDHNYIHRKRLKQLINDNYFKGENQDFYLRLAYYLSVSSFEVVIDLNKLKQRLFKTNPF